MKNFLKASATAVVLAAAAVAVPSAAQAGYAGYVCTADYGAAGRLTLRSAPTTASRAIGYYSKGQNVPLSGWAVVYGSGIPWLYTTDGGFVRADYVCKY